MIYGLGYLRDRPAVENHYTANGYENTNPLTDSVSHVPRDHIARYPDTLRA